MSRTSGSTQSPIPISPFSPSPYSTNSDSHYTSDDQPDLGAFRTVLREWVHLQPQWPPRIPMIPVSTGGTSATHSTVTGTVEDQRSTVWAQRPIADYLDLDRQVSVSMSSSSKLDDTESSGVDEDGDEDDTDTDTEGARTVEIESATASATEDIEEYFSYTSTSGRTQIRTQPSDSSESELDVSLVSASSSLSSLPLSVSLRRLGSESPPISSPSLGYLDEALSFIASERAKWEAGHARGDASQGKYSHCSFTALSRSFFAPRSDIFPPFCCRTLD